MKNNGQYVVYNWKNETFEDVFGGNMGSYLPTKNVDESRRYSSKTDAELRVIMFNLNARANEFIVMKLATPVGIDNLGEFIQNLKN